MADLTPYPFGALVRRMFRELKSKGSIFDLPASKFYTGAAKGGGAGAHDFSVRFHGHRAGTPLGPAAGPQTQLAQNIVLAWLTGARIFELKTVQVLDELELPRPCIDMQTIGFNVEWSQELKLHQSLEEYVKASMLIQMLQSCEELEGPAFSQPFVFDMSVGYDLAGIQSEPVQAFLRGMRDATAVIDRLRAEIPPECAELRVLDYRHEVSDTLTLSTFHGCPPEEIEQISEHLLRDHGLHVIVKLNPTLLGSERLRGLLHDQLGYSEIVVPDSAFANDTRWEQAVGFTERLGSLADSLGLSFGVKFTNTLLVRNHRDFFPASASEMYLSGAPLHVLAVNLVDRFRQTFAGRFPVSFSAGIDRKNYADAVALGLTPVTVCSDLLKPGGYGRATAYHRELAARMDKVGARHIPDFILRAYGHAQEALDDVHLPGDQALTPEQRQRCMEALGSEDVRAALETAGLGPVYEPWVEATAVRNTATYAARATADPRYAKAKNSKPPRKVGSHLSLFDCVSCDKCVPVCPNDANFVVHLAPREVPKLLAAQRDGAWVVTDEGTTALVKPHQIANFADLCNECGNCDVFCPEDGGPYAIKPRFFGSLDAWTQAKHRDGGFYMERAEGDAVRVYGRFDGAEFTSVVTHGEAHFAGQGFSVRFDPRDPRSTFRGEAEDANVQVDLTYFYLMEALREALIDSGDVNPVSCLVNA